MPGMNARELADEMRKRRPELKVIFTAGYTEDIFADGEMFANIDKPHTFDKLATLVREVLEE